MASACSEYCLLMYNILTLLVYNCILKKNQKEKRDLYSFNVQCIPVVSFTKLYTLWLCSLLAKDKGGHTNPESTVYTVVVVCLYWLVPIRKTTTPVTCMIYRHAVRLNNVYCFRNKHLKYEKR